MRRNKLGICMAFALLSVAPAHAGWLNSITPSTVGSDISGTSDEYVYFSTSQTISNPAGCANADVYIIRKLTKNALVTLLAALVADKDVRVYVNDTTCDSATGRPLADQIAIER